MIGPSGQSGNPGGMGPKGDKGIAGNTGDKGCWFLKLLFGFLGKSAMLIFRRQG